MCIIHLPVFPDLSATLCFVPRPSNVALNKAGKIFLVTEFAFLRQESDDKQVNK